MIMSFFKEYDAFKAEYDRFVKAAFEEEVIREMHLVDPQIQKIEWRKFTPLSEGVFSYCGFCENKAIKIKDVIFNNPATIVFWSDGTKTVVKAENEPFDREKGLAMAISKKFLGNKGNYFETFKKFIKEDTK